ncbi:MAG TPA: RES family NAD+ phosphorylase [Mycobacteriales bacterium]|nr:RES family NAD+ phosphorylase [Mycobacteriales bacterium]
MAKFPWPPPMERLHAIRRDEDIVAIAPMTGLARIYLSGGRYPSNWNDFRTIGPVASARFDPHPPTADGTPAPAPGCGVLYAAVELQTCLAESFQASRVVDRHTGRPWLVVFRSTRVLRLLDLTGTWPTRAGASQAISSGARDRARAWAREIREAYDDIDGLWYRSSMDRGQPAVCLWESARGAMPAGPWAHLPLDAPALVLPLARACRAIGYQLL